MKLIEQIATQRHKFLQKYADAPNRLLVPLDDKYELMGEVVEFSGHSFDGKRPLFLIGMRVCYTQDVNRIEAAFHLEENYAQAVV